MMVALASCLVSLPALAGCGNPTASPSSLPTGRGTREPAPPSPVVDRIPAHLLPSDAPVPAPPALLNLTNAWIVSDGVTLLEVCAGSAGNDPHTGRFFILRQDDRTGQQKIDSVDVPLASALTIVDPPSGSAVETSAQRGTLSFVGRGGIKGALDLSTDKVTRTWVPPAAVTVGVATLRFSPSYTELFAAAGQQAYAVVLPPETWPPRHAIRVIEIAGDGRVVKQRSLVVGRVYANDIRTVSAGPDGLYIGTGVLHRFFPHVPDELLRIDPSTLAIVAKAKFSDGVGAVEQGQQLRASIDDGRVLRLDPRHAEGPRLETGRAQADSCQRRDDLGCRRQPSGRAASGCWLSDEHQHLDLVRLDPTSLAVRSRTPVLGRAARSPRKTQSATSPPAAERLSLGRRSCRWIGRVDAQRGGPEVEGRPSASPTWGRSPWTARRWSLWSADRRPHWSSSTQRDDCSRRHR